GSPEGETAFTLRVKQLPALPAAAVTGFAEWLRHFAKPLGVGQRPKLAKRLVLDLADALARHVERAADLVERQRRLTVEAVAQLDDRALALGELREDALERVATHRGLGRFVGQRLGFVPEEVPELGVLVVADRLLQRNRHLRSAPNLVDLFGRELDLLGD